MPYVKPRRWGAEQGDGDEVYLFAIDRTYTKQRTAIQDVEIVETSGYGKMLILDGLVQSAEDDEHLYHEALVHPCLVAHPDPCDVLIIGGGEGATLREVLRYPSVERVTMVDIDGELVEICKEHLPEWHRGSYEDPRTELVITDGRAFLETTDRSFDVIISDITDFLDHGPAMRLYTREFYELVASRLKPGGILVVQALGTSVVDTEEHSTLYRTLREVFSVVRSYVAFVPSFIYTWGFLTASMTLDPSALEPEEVDTRLAERLTSPLRSYEGAIHRSLFTLTKDLRILLEAPGPILDDATIESWADNPNGKPELLEACRAQHASVAWWMQDEDEDDGDEDGATSMEPDAIDHADPRVEDIGPERLIA